MQNIFEIQQEYLKIVSEIEANDGELTEEQEYDLKINLDNLESKLKAYAKIITLKQVESDACDKEIKRLTNLKKTRDNLIVRLKEHIRDAVVLYGRKGKSGNSQLDFDTVKFYTRIGKSLVIPNEFFSQDYMNDNISIKIPAKYENDIMEHIAKLDNDVLMKLNINVKAEPDKDLIKSSIGRLDVLEKSINDIKDKINKGIILTDEEQSIIEEYTKLESDIKGCEIVSKESVIIK